MEHHVVMVYRSVFVLEGRRQRGANERKRRKEKREREEKSRTNRAKMEREEGGDSNSPRPKK